ncbi:hypothetical protein RchiOBHm_Chr4g0395541 [Rosa chinensis]|uniref:Uncharacterized protein n=1 Tax=Rosa chinensis TaxID=74649 RepID=A0A2P6QRN0_ROSCH|nr:hypothetical protein RchiOBHm_Chr4g0395541 [Rosa chinensis]
MKTLFGGSNVVLHFITNKSTRDDYCLLRKTLLGSTNVSTAPQ